MFLSVFSVNELGSNFGRILLLLKKTSTRAQRCSLKTAFTVYLLLLKSLKIKKNHLVKRSLLIYVSILEVARDFAAGL